MANHVIKQFKINAYYVGETLPFQTNLIEAAQLEVDEVDLLSDPTERVDAEYTYWDKHIGSAFIFYAFLGQLDGRTLKSYEVEYTGHSAVKKKFPEACQITIDGTIDEMLVRVYYEKQTATIEITCYDAATEEVIDRQTQEVTESPVDVYAPTISGYKIIKDTYKRYYYKPGKSYIKFYYTAENDNIGGKDTTTVEEVTYSATEDYTAVNESKWDARTDDYGTGCFFLRYENGQIQEVIALPVFPQEFSDTNNVDFNSSTMLGRSVSYQTYNSSSRSVSFTLTLHEEIAIRGKKYYWTTEDNSTIEGSPFGDNVTADGKEYDRVHALVAQIQAACYPGYNEGVVSPPEVEFVIGKQFSIRGILTNCGASWKPPIINGHFVCCDLSIGVTETTGPYSAADITSIRGKRGINRNA